MDKVEGCRQGGEHLKKVDPLCNSSSPALPPASVVSLQVSLSLTLTDYASLSLKAHYLVSPSLYLILPLSLSVSLQPTPPSPSFLCLSANCLFQSFTGAATRCLSRSLSLSVTVRYGYWYKPHPYILDSQ